MQKIIEIKNSMTLGDIIEYLEKQEQKKIVTLGFSNPHSYRGYYDELAVEPTEHVKVSYMLSCLKETLGSTYTGYKGGEFEMNECSDVYLANKGSCGELIGKVMLDYMLRKH